MLGRMLGGFLVECHQYSWCIAFQGEVCLWCVLWLVMAALARLVRWEAEVGEGGQLWALAGISGRRCWRSRSARYRLHSRGDSLDPCSQP